MIKTHSTKDYTKFETSRFQPKNRTYSIHKLALSLKITKGNVYNPILVEEDTMEIIDGHRRLLGCITSKVPVYYIMVPKELALNLMVSMNSTSKQWTMNNYISHFAEYKKEYVELQDFLTETGSSIELFTRFSKNNIDFLKEGVISKVSYKKLNKIRRTALNIADVFGCSNTLAGIALVKAKSLGVTNNTKLCLVLPKCVELKIRGERITANKVADVLVELYSLVK